MNMRLLGLLVVASVSLAACATGEEATMPSTSQPTAPAESRSIELDELATIPEAITITVATNGLVDPVIAWIGPGEVGAANLTTGALGDAEIINDGIEPFAHPIERPGLAVRPDGTIDLAFTALEGTGGSVFYTRSEEGSWSAPELISGDPQPETNLVHIGVGDAGEVALAWLEDSTLSVAPLDGEGDPAEIELVDDLTCDCCNPAPVFVNDSLIVPYRNYELIDGKVVRDTFSVRSLEKGTAFDAHVPIADDHWFIDACPFSGPHAVEVRGSLVVAFMDARQSVHPDQTSTSIWVDVSHDGGVTFGTDLEVAGEGINRWPVMAVDDETDIIHLVWEVQGPEGGLAYSASTDVGGSFTEPIMLIENDQISGSAKTPSVAFQDGALIVTWTDGDGAHVGSIDLR